MATIYAAKDATTITDGLQGSKVCDEAIRAARRWARELGDDVVIDDDDDLTLVHPDGSSEPVTARDVGFEYGSRREIPDEPWRD